MPGFFYETGFRATASRRSQLPFPSPVPASLTPGSEWDGTRSSGFSEPPTDSQRITAKPVVRLLCPPRQTVTGALVVGVFAAANNAGTLIDNWGLLHVDFHCEGATTRVFAPSVRRFEPPDGSTYSLIGWWVTLTKPAMQEGLAELYVEAVPRDGTMQARMTGPFPFLFYDEEFDHDITVAASGGADHTTIAEAFGTLRNLNAQRPRIRITEPGTYDLRGGGGHAGSGYCTIEASAPVVFAQEPPALPYDFTRFRPSYDRLHLKGANITLDFAESLEFYLEKPGRQHWLDGCNIIQSRGRNDLWRGRPRNIIPSLFRDGAYFTDCMISDVNDWGDKAPLARGNRTNSTWGDALQDARCAVANEIVDHSSAPYYANLDALSLQYSGSASTARVTLNGGNGANRTMRLYEDDMEVAIFSIRNSEQAYRDGTNYTVQNVVDFVNAQPDWNATLLDNSRYAAALTSPGSTNGAGFIKLDAKSAPLVLPTHFDIHSDLYQLPNLSVRRANVVFAFNRGFAIDAQNMLIGGTGGLADSFFGCNALYNNLGTLDEGLASQIGADHSHVMIAHNSMPTQALLLRQDLTYDGDAFCLIANNVARRLSVSGGGAIDADITLKNNHLAAGATAPSGGTGTTIGGDVTDLFVDAARGDFTPAGPLLSSGKPPVITLTLGGVARGAAAPAGAD